MKKRKKGIVKIVKTITFTTRQSSFIEKEAKFFECSFASIVRGMVEQMMLNLPKNRCRSTVLESLGYSDEE